MRRFILGFAALVTAAGACSTFGETGNDAPAMPEAGAGSDAPNGAPDAAADGAPIDSGGDSTNDASVTSPCVDASHAVCDDFDQDAMPSRWDPPLVSDGRRGFSPVKECSM